MRWGRAHTFARRQKGFGKEEPGLQKKLEDFFNKYGKTNAVRMRRVDGTKEFKVRFHAQLLA